VFDVERSGEQVFAMVRGIDPAHLKRLRTGEPAPDRDLDLHGLSVGEAREDVAYEVDDAWHAGERCIRIVTGRGRHSALGPVLRDAVIGWLQARPLADQVMAFASAPSSLGGPGALLVLLRRRRPARR
jgi:DNA-nicking Smr family endonuclease